MLKMNWKNLLQCAAAILSLYVAIGLDEQGGEFCDFVKNETRVDLKTIMTYQVQYSTEISLVFDW